MLTGSGLLLFTRINTDMPLHEIILYECIMSVGLGLSMMPVMTGGLTALTGPVSEFGSAFNTLSQRVSQAFGTALLTALITVDSAQFFVGGSALIDGRGANADPGVQQLIRNDQLTAYWQQVSNKAQTTAYSTAFLVAGSLVLASTVIALMLPSGRPTSNSQDLWMKIF